MSLKPAAKNSQPLHQTNGIVLDSAYQGIDEAGWNSLFQQAKKSHLEQFIADLFGGKHINNSENRPALHSALRNLDRTPVLVDGKDVMPDVAEVWHRIEALCNKWVGVTDVIHIGIGGSDLGPQMVVPALDAYVHPGLNFHFCTACMAGTSNSRCEERTTRVSTTSPAA